MIQFHLGKPGRQTVKKEKAVAAWIEGSVEATCDERQIHAAAGLLVIGKQARLCQFNRVAPKDETIGSR
ncbi:MAG TPA: hypothetical protein DCP32_01990 [Anaerolineaceae bacterium]|nr:hypothetical protein [Anaerolineaceae bacterium]